MTENDISLRVGIEGIQDSIAALRVFKKEAKAMGQPVQDLNKEIAIYKKQIESLRTSIGNVNKVSLGKGFLSNDFSKRFTDINSEIKALGSTAQVSFGDVLSNKMKEITPQLGKIQGQFKSLLPSGYEKKFTNINEEVKNLGSAMKEIDLTKAAKSATAGFDSQIKSIKKAESAMTKFRGALLGASLSMLFFGMALKRVFDSAWRFGTKTFNDIMHSVDGTVTGFDQMTNSMTYLGFTIGQALEPVAALLAPIIMAFAEWVSNNQELASVLLITLGVLGSVLFIAGTLGSAFAGLTGLLSLFGIAGSAAIAGLVATISTVLLPILALVTIAIVLWKTNIGGFRTFVVETFKIIFDTIKSVLKNIFNAFERLFKGDIVGVLAELVAAIVKVFNSVGAVVKNVFIFIFNSIKDLSFGFLNWLLGALISVINLINKIPGINIGTSGITDLQKKLTQTSKNMDIKYVTAEDVAAKNNSVDKFLGTGEYYNSAATSAPAQQSQSNPVVNVFLDSEPVAAKIVSKANNVTRSGMSYK